MHYPDEALAQLMEGQAALTNGSLDVNVTDPNTHRRETLLARSGYTV